MAEKKETKKEDTNELTEKELYDVLVFAREMSSMFPGAISPMLINQRMKDISFRPTAVDSDALDDALSDPKNSEEVLRELMENLEIVSMPLKRILSYMASHLAFDLTWTAKVKKATEYTSAKFKKDEIIVEEFFDDFDHKGQFKNAVRQMLRNEMYACCVRDEGGRVVLQELPIDYIKITGRWDYGFLISFDFSYFLQSGVNIDFYPSWFKKTFTKIYSGESGQGPYSPPVNPNARGGSHFAQWVDVPPDENIWVFKFDETLVTAIPYFTGLMADLINQDLMRGLQKDANMSAASRMLVGAVPMLKEAKSNVKDMIAIEAETLGKFLALVKAGLSTAVKVAAAPLDDMQKVEFKAENDIYDSYLRTSLASSGMNSALFYTSDLKANTIESQLSFQSDHLIMETLYAQFVRFLEYQLKRRTKSFRFFPELEGNDYYLDRTKRLEDAKLLAEMGIVLPHKFAAAKGMKPSTMRRAMEYAQAIGFVDNLTPIVPASQTPAEEEEAKAEAGRPKLGDSEISESGAQTRETSKNEEEKTKNR